VSPLWRDQIRIALCPDKVVLVRMARGWHPRIADKRVVPCDAADTGEAPWQPAVAALKEALPAFAKSRADAVAIISNGFVHYTLVPWSDQLVGEDEEQAYVRHQFARIHGDRSARWAFRASADAADAPRVASAVDQRLLDALETTARERKLRLGSIQPYLMSAVNQWRQSFKGLTGWFALVEGGRLCLALFHRDRWHTLRIAKLGADWTRELALILDREQHLVDLPGIRKEVFLFAPEETELAMPTEGGWSVRRLVLPQQPGFSPRSEAPFSLAMGG
jgi:hypothetical protein